MGSKKRLPQRAGWAASALSLSRPAQASLTLRPAGSLSRPEATFVTRLQPMRLPAYRPAREGQGIGLDRSTFAWGAPSVQISADESKILAAARRMTRECQVRFCERLGVKFPEPTRQFDRQH